MASIKFYPKSAKYQAIVRKKGHATQYKMFSKEDDAIKWAKQTEVDMERNVFVDSKEASTTTLIDALGRYEAIAKQNKGYESERYRIDVWKASKLAKRTIATLRSKDFDEYRDQRRAEGVSDATIRNDLAVIAAIFKHFDFGMTNPVAKTAKTLDVAKKRSRRLTALEQKYLMAQLEDTGCSDPKRANKWIPVVTRFAIETAARLSEIVGKDKTRTEPAKYGLIWENVNFDKSICKLIDTKNGESRFVPLSPAAVDCLNISSTM